MSQAWCNVFLNLHNNLFQIKGKLVRMVNQKRNKFESFQKLIKTKRLIKIHFFADVHWVIYRIRWENKHFDVTRAQMSVTQISCHSQQVVFHKYFSLFLLNNIIVMVFHAVISIHLISIVYLTQIVTGVGKSKKKYH